MRYVSPATGHSHSPGLLATLPLLAIFPDVYSVKGWGELPGTRSLLLSWVGFLGSKVRGRAKITEGTRISGQKHTKHMTFIGLGYFLP